MILKTSKLRDAITYALMVGAATAFTTGTAFAQDQAASTEQQDTAQTLDTVVVTGTRIQSQTITASSPVTEIAQEEFQYTGATRTEDLVNQYPQLSPAFDSMNNNPSLGYPTVDLRGLGANRTLTLVNGKRLAPGAAEFTDISIVPSFMVQRVDLLTGGASAVYGSDAVAGVVNFILDTEFEGVKMNVGGSGYQHNNDNKYMQNNLRARDFAFPTGNSGLDGKSYNVDVAVGSSFADDRGHAMAWMTWRKNDALFQGERDYSSCALTAAGVELPTVSKATGNITGSTLACGGSATNAAGNFYFYNPATGQGSPASLNPDGSYLGAYGAPYNYAPVNYYQRPDERYTFGSSVKFEVNEYFKPYLETMFINKKDAVEIAPSGAFFTAIQGIDCNDPLIGSACTDLGFDPADGPLNVYVAKRNVEGGPRHTDTDTTQFRIVGGVTGKIDADANWTYDVSYLYGQNNSDIVGINDFLSDRIVAAILDGSYDVFTPGGVTPEAAAALAGVSLTTTKTETSSFTAFITGDTGFGLPWANNENVAVAVGGVHTADKFAFRADSNSVAGNFAGAGGPAVPISGKISVSEFFAEAGVPVVRDAGFLKSLDLDLGYRISDYNLAGRAETFKVGLGADMGMFRVRGGYNRAIRAPRFAELFANQAIALFGGTDPCAGASPKFTAAQCANTGVSASQYGHVPDNPAGQYNQFIGGNLETKPEKADTYTLGFVVTPIDELRVALDYYDIKIEDQIGTVGAQTILEQCGLTGNADLCALVQRAGSGDLWRGNDPATAGKVVNLTGNFGEQRFRGLDLNAFYRWDMFGGKMMAGFQGNYLLEQETAPLMPASDTATFDCAGKINVACQAPKWRHIANIRYSRDWGSVNLRWRYFGDMDYVDNMGAPLFADKLLCKSDAAQPVAIPKPSDPATFQLNPKYGCIGDGKLAAYNYLDLSASVLIGSFGELTVGVNNIADKEPPLVGNSQALNGNAPGGYDQAGRFFFTSFTVKF
jgi:iron complex outermembrane receptor protein